MHAFIQCHTYIYVTTPSFFFLEQAKQEGKYQEEWSEDRLDRIERFKSIDTETFL
jgi:hypothetical protein